ncbi:Phosphoinositide-3-kinase, class 3 [Giardia muris]|uniref:Phosphoinositide-3-kinase, class 3 n=1 Tax=Giardia muris TaxID=5742 RepID=A0A4Z1T9H2_GIAMU|nr:Phosphoinositide-3-kinase, class 3 [Giardia muris]|eukprot:TNJ29797.1 Phosphoinositide-3-kinase, class 3 [Giardia muris]
MSPQCGDAPPDTSVALSYSASTPLRVSLQYARAPSAILPKTAIEMFPDIGFSIQLFRLENEPLTPSIPLPTQDTIRQDASELLYTWSYQPLSFSTFISHLRPGSFLRMTLLLNDQKAGTTDVPLYRGLLFTPSTVQVRIPLAAYTSLTQSLVCDPQNTVLTALMLETSIPQPICYCPRGFTTFSGEPRFTLAADYSQADIAFTRDELSALLDRSILGPLTPNHARLITNHFKYLSLKENIYDTRTPSKQFGFMHESVIVSQTSPVNCQSVSTLYSAFDPHEAIAEEQAAWSGDGLQAINAALKYATHIRNHASGHATIKTLNSRPAQFTNQEALTLIRSRISSLTNYFDEKNTVQSVFGTLEKKPSVEARTMTDDVMRMTTMQGLKLSSYNPLDYVLALSYQNDDRDDVRDQNAMILSELAPRMDAHPETLVPDSITLAQLLRICSSLFPSRMKPQERQLVWKYRYYMRKHPRALLATFHAMPNAYMEMMSRSITAASPASDATQQAIEAELANLLMTWEMPALDQILILLTRPYSTKELSTPIIRRYALMRLHEYPDDVIVKYLFPLTLCIMHDEEICKYNCWTYQDIYKTRASDDDDHPTLAGSAPNVDLEQANESSSDSIQSVELLLKSGTFGLFGDDSLKNSFSNITISSDDLDIELVQPRVQEIESRPQNTDEELLSIHGRNPSRQSLHMTKLAKSHDFPFVSLSDLLVVRAVSAPYTYYLLPFYIELWYKDACARGDEEAKNKFNMCLEAYRDILKLKDHSCYNRVMRTKHFTGELLNLVATVKSEVKGGRERQAEALIARLKDPATFPSLAKVPSFLDVTEAAEDDVQGDNGVIFPFVTPPVQETYMRKKRHRRTASCTTTQLGHDTLSALGSVVNTTIEGDTPLNATSPSGYIGLTHLSGVSSMQGKALHSDRHEIYASFRTRFVHISRVEPTARVFKSAKSPVMLTLIEADTGRKIPILIKRDDDLRLDMLTIQLFSHMNDALITHNLDLRFSIYKCFAISPTEGFVECILPSVSQDDIAKGRGFGSVQAYLNLMICKYRSQVYPEAFSTALSRMPHIIDQAVGSLIATNQVALLGEEGTSSRLLPQASGNLNGSKAVDASVRKEVSQPSMDGGEAIRRRRKPSGTVSRHSRTASHLSGVPEEKESSETGVKEVVDAMASPVTVDRPRRAVTTQGVASRLVMLLQTVGFTNLHPNVQNLLNRALRDFCGPPETLDLMEGMSCESQLSNFIRSSAGYSIATYLLAIGDRHGENLLFRPDGRMFHIDFGWCFGQDPKYTLPVKITKDIVLGMGGEDSAGFAQFQSYMSESFTILRSEAYVPLTFMQMMRGGSIKPLEDAAQDNFRVIEERYQLTLSKDVAVHYIHGVIRNSIDSLMSRVIDALHRFAQRARR